MDYVIWEKYLNYQEDINATCLPYQFGTNVAYPIYSFDYKYLPKITWRNTVAVILFHPICQFVKH